MKFFKFTCISSLAAIVFSLFLISCASLKYGTPVSLEISTDKGAAINYGTIFQVQVFMNYSKGKKIDITKKSSLTIKTHGAVIKNDDNTIYTISHPTSFKFDTVFVDATYQKGEDIISTRKAILFNYADDLDLFFNGENGADGLDGKSGGTPILFRMGGNGKNGTDGLRGKDGHNISVYIYKDLKSNFYKLKVTDSTIAKSYFYLYKNNNNEIKIFSQGGKGGKGGYGGDGGNGKDGKQTDKKTKEPGNGGNGGKGGNGGDGGNGGTAYVYIHPSAKDSQDKIFLINIGGEAGTAGVGGKAGAAGTPLDGQEEADDGSSGSSGFTGSQGKYGKGMTIKVTNFKIDF